MQKFILINIIAIMFLFGHIVLCQDDYKYIQLHDISKTTGSEVTFLENPPVIDGILDKNLESLPVRSFCHGFKKEG